MWRLLVLLPLVFILAPEHQRPQEAPTLADSTNPPGPIQDITSLAAADPVAFLEASIARYDREVRGFRATLLKQERIAGKLQPPERVACWFREKPFSVLMEWKDGARLAKKTLYVEGENDGKLLVLPAGLLGLAGVVKRDPDGEDARSSARYPATDFGIQKGALRTLKFWKRARDAGTLDVRFEGLLPVPELGGRECWKLSRRYASPEDDGIRQGDFYFDPATWLQVGTVLRDGRGELIAKYFWRELVINPAYPEGVFTRASLLK
jgi:hypothetical protein